MLELLPGQTYNVRLAIRNTSTKGGAPVAATLGVGIFAMAGVMLIDRQVSLEYFTAGQTRQFVFPMTVVPAASGPGAITAWVEDPSGTKLNQAIADILVSGYKVSFTGTVTDAETHQALPGATVEMWNENATALISSTTTNSAGQYGFSGIVVPVTLIFKYKKSGYRDTVTIPIYLDPSGGGLLVEMVPLVPTQLALYYSNPNSTAATHWNIYDFETGKWLAGTFKLINEAIVFVPATNRLFVVFREALNVFFDMVEYGPYIIDVAGLGQYTWDARSKTLNGVKAVSLMNTIGSIRGKVVSQEATNNPSYQLFGIQVLSAIGSPGSYFLGKTIKVEASKQLWSLVGTEITCDLKVQITSPGNFQQYPGFVLVISNIGFPLGLPEYLFAYGGGSTRGWDPEDGRGFFAIQFYSKYGLPGIPILFEAWGGGVRRDLVYQEQSGGTVYYGIGNPGTQSIQKTLPTNDVGYWLNIFHGFQDARIDVSLLVNTGFGEVYWKKVTTL